MDISVVICTHNPDSERLQRCLEGLSRQTLPAGRWETIIVDNASTPAVEPSFGSQPASLRIVREPHLGLTSARKTGLRSAEGRLVVFSDDDNVLAPDYLSEVLKVFSRLSKAGAIGGKSCPEFSKTPPAWSQEFFPLLALRDLGDAELVSNGLYNPSSQERRYPEFAPIGAGMAVRQEAIKPWLEQSTAISDRRGGDLSSGGDNDIVLTILEAGWEVAYAPTLQLMHLIPSSRIDPHYLARLNHGIQKSWMQVLSRHDANPWPPLSSLGARFRKLKAWLKHRPWSGPAERIRWRGACGHFEGRVS